VSESVEAPASTGEALDAVRGDTVRNGETGLSCSTSAILFNELVLSHFRWFALFGRYGEFGGLPAGLAPAGWLPSNPPTEKERKEADSHYREKLKEFTDAEGEIVAAYWAVTVPSGIVMTIQDRGRMLNFLLGGPKISLHRATTWLTASDWRVAELLHHCDTLGNRSAQILTRTPKRVAMTWIFSTESYLLGILEARSWGPIDPRSDTASGREVERTPAETADDESGADAESLDGSIINGALATELAAEPADESTHADLITRARAEIIEIEKYYDRAASNAARFLYFWGMLAGAVIAGAVAVLIALIAAVSFDVIKLDSTNTRFFFACYTAGALGAIVSVLTRMRSDRFSLDYEVGRAPAFWLGAFRPFIGAIFGLVVYFALRSELVHWQEPDKRRAFFFFTFLAFVSGFSERLAHVILGGAERTVQETLEQADKALGEESTTTRVSANGKTRVITHKRTRGNA
jgi:hypothetical protein